MPSPSKLSDAQLVLLSSAAQHPQGAIKLDLKGAAAKKVAAKLLGEGLAEEVPSRDTLPEWRRDDGLGSLALCITKRGLAAIGVEAGIVVPRQTVPSAYSPRACARGSCGGAHTSRPVMRPLSGDARPLKKVALIAIETRCRNVGGRSLSCVPKGTGRRRRTTFGIWTACARRIQPWR